VTGNLAAQLRQQMLALRESRDLTESLLSLSRKLAAAPDTQSILKLSAEHVLKVYRATVVILQPNEEKELEIVTATEPLLELDTQDQASARWAWSNGQPAGWSTNTLSNSRFWFVPLRSERGMLALMGLMTSRQGRLSTEQRRQVEALSQQIAQALERSRLVEDLESARIQGETEQLRSALLSSISHDLRTPLTTMIGSIGSLLSYGERIPASERQELLQGTLDEAERLNRYIQNLLDMTRLGYGKLKIQRDWVALGDIVSSACHRLKSVLSPLRVQIQIAPTIPLLYVHAALLEQALVNILENAARFSPPHGMIRIEARCQEDSLVVDICDQGPGIAEEDRDKVFNMFYSVAHGDRKQGTGLGLAICQGMVGAHGGRVDALPGVDGQGTCMRVWLPLANQPELPQETDVEMNPNVG